MRHVDAPVWPLARSDSPFQEGPRSEEDAAVLRILLLDLPLSRQCYTFEHWDLRSIAAAQDPEVAEIFVNVIRLIWERDMLHTFWLQHHEVFTCLAFFLIVAERALTQLRLA